MHISNESLLALQILSDESHPNMHFSRVKNGFSLFSTPDHTVPTVKICRSYEQVQVCSRESLIQKVGSQAFEG